MPDETRQSLAAYVSIAYEDREQMELSDLLSRVLDDLLVRTAARIPAPGRRHPRRRRLPGLRAAEGCCPPAGVVALAAAMRAAEWAGSLPVPRVPRGHRSHIASACWGLRARIEY